MRIVVDRFLSDAETTLSKILVDGSFACFGLEDEFREQKVAKETRIPAGTYSIELQTEGTLHQKYSQRFADIHRGMLHLRDVPGFPGTVADQRPRQRSANRTSRDNSVDQDSGVNIAG